jgi:hypothetical protein
MLRQSWCSICKHDLEKKVPEREGFLVFTCKAFPDGIPWVDEIVQEGHKKPYPGDNGIQFESIYEN